jgi:hypothetical protein
MHYVSYLKEAFVLASWQGHHVEASACLLPVSLLAAQPDMVSKSGLIVAASCR